MAQNVLSITQLTEYIRGRLDDDPFLGQVAVRGEISNYKVYPSGHHYFTLKDEGAALKCVMFKGNAMRLRFRPDNGMKVIAMGKVTVYPRDGAYQLYCAAMAMDGVGDLYAAFEQLKKKLAAQGLFDPAHKKLLPKCPGTIGIVTSSAGAAVHDMLRILRKRYPLTKVRLLPVRVQGAEAPGEIAAAIRYANRYRLADLLIVGRGGGSIEDLWAFNERMVAQAVFDCSVPIISAVGHETDTTIIDYVADLRAPTPSAAAELAVTQVSDIENEILDRQDRLYQRMGRVLQHKRQQADQMEMRLKYLSPASRIREKRTYSIQLEDRLQNRLQAILRERRHNLALYIERMKAVSPLEKLNSGFSYVEDTDGKNIRSVTQVEAGERLRIRMSDGVIDTRVEQIQKEERLPG